MDRERSITGRSVRTKRGRGSTASLERRLLGFGGVLIGSDDGHVLELLLGNDRDRLEDGRNDERLEQRHHLRGLAGAALQLVIVLWMIVIVTLADLRGRTAALAGSERARGRERRDRIAEQCEHRDDREQPAQKHLDY